ncbi:MAG: diguanylate cyclase [Actinobacteria bacterium]|nr:diguanylate cyclase [Actinomycetota bacterium]
MSRADPLAQALASTAAMCDADAAVAWLAQDQSGVEVTAVHPPTLMSVGAVWPVIDASGVDDAIRQGPHTDPAELSRLLPISFRLSAPHPVTAAWPVRLTDDGSGLMLIWWHEPSADTSGAPVSREQLAIAAEQLELRALRRRVHQEAARLDAVNALLHQALVFTDDSGGPGQVNAAAARLLGLPVGQVPSERIGRALASLRDRSTEADSIAARARQILKDPAGRIEDWYWHFEEDPTDLRVSSAPITAEGVSGRLWVFDDVSMHLRLVRQAKAAQAAAESARAELARSEERFRVAMESSAVGVALARPDGTIMTANPAWRALLGQPGAEVVGSNWFDLVAQWGNDDEASLRNSLLAGKVDSYRADVVVTVDGRQTLHLDASVAASRTAQGAVSSLVIQVNDVTTVRAQFHEAKHLAGHDSLTGLPNRSTLLARLAAASADDGPPVGVLFCDLDGFKAVNDTLGHAAGDEVLAVVARRLEAAVGSAGIVARLGGDEFVVMCRHGAGSDGLLPLGERILAAVAHPIDLTDGAPVTIGVSIGVAVRTSGETPADLLARADAGAYAAKRAGRNRVVAAPPP